MSTAAPHLEAARAGLEQNFGLRAFRPGQAEVIASVMAGRNTVVVMPTGAGKSLCYQLPATLLPGLTVVVSPLIALMKDQVEALAARGIAATLINSTLTDLERADRLRRLRGGEFRLVYVAPERFRSPAFLDTLANTGVELLAIDEAHCISQWGHDFRPDYSQLGQVRKRLRPPRTVALTATATPEVREDIVRSLLMKDPQVFVAGFDRHNLFLEVVPVGGDEEKRDLCAELAARGESGIVYCSTRKTAEATHQALKTRGIKSVLYHAGMDDPARQKAQDQFMSTNAVAVATNAFGMGIDKPDIRFVAHAGIPRAVEAYYQEIGRAGRDGRPAHAALLFNHADVFTQERLIQSSYPAEPVFADVWNALAEEEEFTRGLHSLAAQTGASEFEISAVLRVLERYGKINRASRGEGAWELTLHEKARTTHPTSSSSKLLLAALLLDYPVGRRSTTQPQVLARRTGLSEDQVRHALSLLERAGAVAVRRPFSGRSIRVQQRVPFRDLGLDLSQVRKQERQSLLLLRRMTDYAYSKRCRRRFILRYFGEEVATDSCESCNVCVPGRIRRRAAAPRSAPLPVGPSPHSALAAEALRKWRRDLSRELGVPPFILFNDATLLALATALPIDRSGFLAVKGTGEAQWERFGPKVVEVCLMARAAGDQPRPAAVARAKRRRKAV